MCFSPVLSDFPFRQIIPSLSSFFLRLDAVSHWASQVVPIVQNLSSNVGDTRDRGSIPGPGRSPMSRKWQSITVFLLGKFQRQSEPGSRVTNSQTQLSTHEHTHTHTHTHTRIHSEHKFICPTHDKAKYY